MAILYFVYISILILIILFQFFLVFGAPLGEYTLGGQIKGKLPTKYRILPVISILILAYFIYFTLVYIGYSDSGSFYSSSFKYFVIFFNGLAAVLNTITKSRKERKLWMPITIVMFVTALFIFL